MSSIEQVIKDYRSTLETLERNDKIKINVLTILAEDYAGHSSHIVKVVEDAIFDASEPSLKLLRLYLIDSIVKNVTSAGNYADNFSVNLAKVFLHVFQRGDEKIRASMFKLRNTWQNVFPRGKLYLLDAEVHNVDPKWPIAAPQHKNGNAKVATTQQPKQQPVKRPATKAPVVKAEPTRHAAPRPTAPTTNTTTGGARRPPQRAGANRIHVNPRFVQEPANKKKRSESPTAFPMRPTNVPSPNVFEMTPQDAPKQPPPPVFTTTQPAVTLAQPTPSFAPMTQQKPPMRTEAPRLPSSHPTNSWTTLDSKTNEVSRPQTPPIIIPKTQSPPPMSIPAAQSIPVTQPPPNLHFHPPRMVQPQQTSHYQNQMQQPPQIRNEAPRLPNLPSNNRIFVDGKAYEVFYLDNIAVIERNGVPHRISFCGPSRDVIIDGVAHRMAFGETKPVTIDGQVHYLRFGAPSRELYMGEFAFKGAFGGPPIAATINGKRHEIRLCGPPPEVKIEQDPCYELIRHMQNVRQNNPPPEWSQPKKEDKDIKLGDLLAKLQKTGVLDTLSTAVKAESNATKPSSSAATPPPPTTREASPPIIPSNIKMDKFEKRESPTSPLSQFYMPDLKIRYVSIIKSLHQKRSTCPDCGIYFDDTNSPNYRNHLDEHIQSEINSLNTIHPMGKSRGRYLNDEDWVAHSKVDDLNRPPPNPLEIDAEESSSDEDEES